MSNFPSFPIFQDNEKYTVGLISSRYPRLKKNYTLSGSQDPTKLLSVLQFQVTILKSGDRNIINCLIKYKFSSNF